MASVAFDDEAVADFFDHQVDAGRKPEQFARIWLHSHPGDSPQPSTVDEETFERVFGRCQWAVMFVVGRSGKTYARLRFSVGPGARGLASGRGGLQLSFRPKRPRGLAGRVQGQRQAGFLVLLVRRDPEHLHQQGCRWRSGR